MDEPTEGLAPVLVREVGDAILRLKEEGLSIFLVEQNLAFAQEVRGLRPSDEQGADRLLVNARSSSGRTRRRSTATWGCDDFIKGG